MSTISFTRQPTDVPLNILFLEDNLRDRELVDQKLQATGLKFNLVYAATRAEYEMALDSSRFDLILSDFALPSYNGEAALVAARELQPETPFLFVSGTIGEERAVESLKSGATDYVIKGHLERLIPAVRRALREAADHRRRHQAEEDLRASEARYREVFDNTSDCIFLLDVLPEGQFKVVRFNAAEEKEIGISNDFAAGKLIGEFLSPATAAQVTANYRRCVEAGTRIEYEEELDLPAGRRYFHTTLIPIRDAAGQICRIIGIGFNLTERKKAEDRLRDQAKLLDMAQDAIVVKDANACVISWNRGAEELYGWTAAEVFGRKVTDFLYPDPAVYATINQALLAKGDWSGELHHLTRSGKKVIVSSRATLMRDEQGNPKSVLIINTDITEKKQLEAQFLRAQRMESIGTLAGGIAHDLNNILAPISICAQIMRMKPLDKETEEMVDRIETSAHRGAEVVRQVLTFARGIEGERALLQPRHLLKEVLKIAQDTFPKSIAITYSVGEDLWPITGNATQLHQVLLNLLVNARDAMPAGGKLRCTAENLLVEDAKRLLPGSKAGPYVLLQVNDTGAGIPADLLEKIFEPFFTTKELGKGTGLGLSTVLGIVKSHGGTVNVYSEPGQGTSFKIYLPATPSALAPPVPGARTALPQGHGELILLVDDEAPIRDVISKILIRHGYNVLVAADGVDGLTMFTQQAGKIQLVLTDMMMPRMEGMALIRALKKIDPKIKIIASSGLANIADQTERSEQLKALGIQDFIAKPCTAEKLLNAVYQGLA